MTMGRFFRASLPPIAQDCDAYVKDIAAALQAGGFGRGGSPHSLISVWFCGGAYVSPYHHWLNPRILEEKNISANQPTILTLL